MRVEYIHRTNLFETQSWQKVLVMAKRECLTSSAEVLRQKRRDVRLDVKIVVGDCESGDIVWQQTRNNSSRNT